MQCISLLNYYTINETLPTYVSFTTQSSYPAYGDRKVEKGGGQAMSVPLEKEMK